MVTTRSSASDTPVQPDPLAAIAAKLVTLDDLREKVAALEAQSRENRGKTVQHWADDSDDNADHRHLRPPRTKIEFPKFQGGDPRGWILKAEKFFRFYGTREEEKVDVASMYLDGDALDLFSWFTTQHTLLYWDEFVRLLQEHFGPPEYQNPDEYLCNIRQTGSVQEYRQEWAKRVARVAHWPEHCLLGVFLNGLREELKADVRIHKPRSVFRASSLALEFEGKAASTCGPKPISYSTQSDPSPIYPQAQCEPNRSALAGDPSRRLATPTPFSGSSATPAPPTLSSQSATPSQQPYDAIKQQRRDKGLCFRCAAPFRPGHRCSASFSLMEVDEEGAPVPASIAPVEDAPPHVPPWGQGGFRGGE